MVQLRCVFHATSDPIHISGWNYKLEVGRFVNMDVSEKISTVEIGIQIITNNITHISLLDISFYCSIVSIEVEAHQPTFLDADAFYKLSRNFLESRCIAN